ncbi:MAG: DDE-type integrase/transposase/recombinase [Pseudomonadota bacterium]
MALSADILPCPSKLLRAFRRQARETVRIYGPIWITTDKVPTCTHVISEKNAYSFPGQEILHVDRKRRNNRSESDHSALIRITDPGRSVQSLRTAKATLRGIEAFRMIKRGHISDPPPNVTREIRLINELFDRAA